MALLAGLLVLLGTGGASAGILTVKDTGRNSTLGPFAVAPAAFGPAIDKAGVHGLLEAARPLEACQKPMDVSSNSTILLVRRSEPWERTCPFINKVRNAEAAGAKAAVVFDYIGESLLIMSKESTEKSPGIPSVFASAAAGREIWARLESPHMGPFEARLAQGTVPRGWASMLATFSVALLAISGALATCNLARRFRLRERAWRGPHESPMPEAALDPEEVRALPTEVHKAGEPSSMGTCSICLDEAQEGEKVRALPCGHRFHQPCIDQWLIEWRHSVCPLCKWRLKSRRERSDEELC